MEPPDALQTLRRSFYECFHRRADALFELTDAILTADGAAPSPVHLSLKASHRRGWGSFYAALDRGRIGDQALHGSFWSAFRSLVPKGRRPSTPWRQACGQAVRQSAALYSRLLLPSLPTLGRSAHRRRVGLAVHSTTGLRWRELERSRGRAATPTCPRRQRDRRRAGEDLARPIRKARVCSPIRLRRWLRSREGAAGA